jgi:SAM-dependent methyltransferase/uncharacterized protein YbaR (Trm112 family)
MECELSPILACPKCKSKLKGYRCSKCKKKYKIENGNVPVFVESTQEIRSYPKILKFLNPPDTTYEYGELGYPRMGDKCEPQKSELLAEPGLMLNIGSSSTRYPGVYNLDIGKFKNVDVVADGKELPFQSNVFDTIFIENVLEHVDEPEKMIKEAYRVLRNGGMIYASIPFVFVYHGSPNDYNRYTINGLAKQLKREGFVNIRGGIVSGAGSTINQMLRYYLALLFSFNSKFLFSFFLNVFGWITFPLKYTDILLNKYRMSSTMANVIWASGVKQ